MKGQQRRRDAWACMLSIGIWSLMLKSDMAGDRGSSFWRSPCPTVCSFKRSNVHVKLRNWSEMLCSDQVNKAKSTKNHKQATTEAAAQTWQSITKEELLCAVCLKGIVWSVGSRHHAAIPLEGIVNKLLKISFFFCCVSINLPNYIKTSE